MGGTPVNIKAGKVIKLPPPATAFSPPAISYGEMLKMAALF